MEKVLAVVLAVTVIVIVVLVLTRRLFWVLAFFVAALASCFAMLASIIHFQIFAAVGFFFLMVIFWFITQVIAAGDR
jgi:hypothetical protein